MVDSVVSLGEAVDTSVVEVTFWLWSLLLAQPAKTAIIAGYSKQKAIIFFINIILSLIVFAYKLKIIHSFYHCAVIALKHNHNVFFKSALSVDIYEGIFARVLALASKFVALYLVSAFLRYGAQSYAFNRQIF